MPELFSSDQFDSDGDQSSSRAERTVDEYSRVMREEPPSRDPFAAFAAKPVGTTFEQQQHQEKVILLLRQHPITQLRWIAIALLMVMMPFLFSAVGVFEFLPARFQLATWLGWYMLVIGYALESFLSWFYNVYIITDERVIDVDFHSLIYKNISAAKIDNVEDVTATTGGALRSVFDFGSIKIQTAGTMREFEFDNVPHPNRVTSLLNELLLEEEREKIEGRVN